MKATDAYKKYLKAKSIVDRYEADLDKLRILRCTSHIGKRVKVDGKIGYLKDRGYGESPVGRVVKVKFVMYSDVRYYVKFRKESLSDWFMPHMLLLNGKILGT